MVGTSPVRKKNVVRIQSAPTGRSLAKAATAASALDKRGHSAAEGFFLFCHFYNQNLRNKSNTLLQSKRN
jgi:hypothetical protein